MDIYQNLKKDHDEVKSLLAELTTLNDDDDYRHTLIERIASELVPHSRAEEAVFYNTIRASDADSGLVMHSFKEHMEAESLLRILQTKDKTKLDWKKTANKLKEALEHHIQEEESKVFSLAQNILTNQEAEQVGEAFLKLKGEIKGEGVLKSSLDIAINLLPPRLTNKVRDLNLNNLNVNK